MSKPLRSLADIHIGHSFRTGIENDPQGDIHVLQIRDIRASTDIQVDSLPRVKWSISGKPPLLMPGDVVLPSRGDRYDAALIRSKTPMLASGHLYILHPRTSGVVDHGDRVLHLERVGAAGTGGAVRDAHSGGCRARVDCVDDGRVPVIGLGLSGYAAALIAGISVKSRFPPLSPCCRTGCRPIGKGGSWAWWVQPQQWGGGFPR